MKKAIALLMALAILILPAACGKAEAPEGPGTAAITRPTSPPMPTATPEPAPEIGPFPGGLDDDGPGIDEPTFAEWLELTPELQYKANLFLSNFAEQFFQNYSWTDEDAPARAADFAHLWCKVNAQDRITYQTVDGESYETLDTPAADAVVSRYFPMELAGYDMTALYPANDHAFYRNGVYYYMAGDGEAYNRIAVADTLARQDEETYVISFAVYEVDLDEYFDQGIDSAYYHMSAIDASNSTSLTLLSRGEALVVPGTWAGEDVYQLLEYRTWPIF